MFGLRQQVRRHVHGVSRGIGHDHDLGRAGGQVYAALAEHLELGRGDVRVAGADDPVDWRHAGLRQAIGQRTDRLGAAGDDEYIHSDEAGGAE